MGVARDAAMRGLATILVEQGELASGTTGRFHGQLHSGARYVVRDPDGSLDSRRLVAACGRSAEDRGARVLPGQRVTGLVKAAGAVSGATVVDWRTGGELTVHAEVVVNAAGAWAGQVAALAGCTVPARLGKGVMVAVDRRLVNTVVSRCRMPADGDILVPLGAELVIGTTDATVGDPGDSVADPESVRRMTACGEE